MPPKKKRHTAPKGAAVKLCIATQRVPDVFDNVMKRLPKGLPYDLMKVNEEILRVAMFMEPEEEAFDKLCVTVSTTILNSSWFLHSGLGPPPNKRREMVKQFANEESLQQQNDSQMPHMNEASQSLPGENEMETEKADLGEAGTRMEPTSPSPPEPESSLSWREGSGLFPMIVTRGMKRNLQSALNPREDNRHAACSQAEQDQGVSRHTSHAFQKQDLREPRAVAISLLPHFIEYLSCNLTHDQKVWCNRHKPLENVVYEVADSIWSSDCEGSRTIFRDVETTATGRCIEASYRESKRVNQTCIWGNITETTLTSYEMARQKRLRETQRMMQLAQDRQLAPMSPHHECADENVYDDRDRSPIASKSTIDDSKNIDTSPAPQDVERCAWERILADESIDAELIDHVVNMGIHMREEANVKILQGGFGRAFSHLLEKTLVAMSMDLDRTPESIKNLRMLKRLENNTQCPFGEYQETSTIDKTMQEYIRLMNEEDATEARKFRSEFCPEWTAEALHRYNVAYARFRDNVYSNRLIAEYMGMGFHPNHIAIHKRATNRTSRLAKEAEDFHTARIEQRGHLEKRRALRLAEKRAREENYDSDSYESQEEGMNQVEIDDLYDSSSSGGSQNSDWEGEFRLNNTAHSRSKPKSQTSESDMLWIQCDKSSCLAWRLWMGTSEEYERSSCAEWECKNNPSSVENSCTSIDIWAQIYSFFQDPSLQHLKVLSTIPKVKSGGKCLNSQVDMHSLFMDVQARRGVRALDENGGWNRIGARLGLNGSSGEKVRKLYYDVFCVQGLDGMSLEGLLRLDPKFSSYLERYATVLGLEPPSLPLPEAPEDSEEVANTGPDLGVQWFQCIKCRRWRPWNGSKDEFSIASQGRMTCASNTGMLENTCEELDIWRSAFDYFNQRTASVFPSRVVKVGDETPDLHALFMYVQVRGGYDNVDVCNLWPEINVLMGRSESVDDKWSQRLYNTIFRRRYGTHRVTLEESLVKRARFKSSLHKFQRIIERCIPKDKLEVARPLREAAAAARRALSSNRKEHDGLSMGNDIVHTELCPIRETNTKVAGGSSRGVDAHEVVDGVASVSKGADISPSYGGKGNESVDSDRSDNSSAKSSETESDPQSCTGTLVRDSSVRGAMVSPRRCTDSVDQPRWMGSTGLHRWSLLSRQWSWLASSPTVMSRMIPNFQQNTSIKRRHTQTAKVQHSMSRYQWVDGRIESRTFASRRAAGGASFKRSPDRDSETCSRALAFLSHPELQ